MKTKLLLTCLMLMPLLVFAQKKGTKGKKTGKFHYTANFKSEKEIQGMENKMERVYHAFIGHYTNKAQADTANSPLFREQEIICVPIWQQTRKGEHWLYIGWFAANSYQKSLAQSVIRLNKRGRDTFDVMLYVLPAEEDENFYSYEWAKEQPFTNVDVRKLLKTEVCLGWVVETKAGSVEWVTPQLCAQNISDVIQHHKIDASVSPEYIRFFTQFYTADKQRVFGYDRPIGQQFDRISKQTSIQKAKVSGK